MTTNDMRTGTGRTGRPRKPSALKVLHGDFKGHPGRQNKNEPKITGTDVEAPENMSGEARKIWDYLYPYLTKSGILTPVDRDCLAEYAEATVVVKVARHQIMQFVTGKLELKPGQPNPFNAYSRAVNVMTNFGGRLGLSPADRSRLTVHADEEPDDLIIRR